MLREGQEKILENISSSKSVPGFEAIKAQQEAFLAAFANGFGNWPTQSTFDSSNEKEEVKEKTEDLEAIKQQLSNLQDQLNKLSK
jgi:conjugal transfer/entry exclusion protein